MTTTAAAGTSDGSGTRVVLYSRDGCHLCDSAREVVRAEAEHAGVGWVEVDVDSDAALAADYGDWVPVVEVDGVRQGYFRIDAARLRRVLAAPLA